MPEKITNPSPTAEDLVRAHAEHTVRGPAGQLAMLGIDIGDAARQAVDSKAQALANEAWAEHRAAQSAATAHQTPRPVEHARSAEQVNAEILRGMLQGRSGIVGNIYLPQRGQRVEGVAEYQRLKRLGLNDEQARPRVRVTAGHTVVANEKGGLCAELTKDKPNRIAMQRFEAQAVTEVVTIPQRQVTANGRPAFYERVDGSSPQAKEPLYRVSYDTGIQRGPRSRDAQWRMDYYLSTTDHKELQRIATETPQVLRDGMREATEAFVTSTALTQDDIGRQAWELDRPPYEQWQERGVDGFAIRNNLSDGPDQSQIFSFR